MTKANREKLLAALAGFDERQRKRDFKKTIFNAIQRETARKRLGSKGRAVSRPSGPKPEEMATL